MTNIIMYNTFSFCNYPNRGLAAASSHPLKCLHGHINIVNAITFLISGWIAEGND